MCGGDLAHWRQLISGLYNTQEENMYIIHRMRTCIQDFLFLSDTGPIIVLRSSCSASDLKTEVTLVVENANFGHQ